MSHTVYFTVRPIQAWKRKRLSHLCIFDVVSIKQIIVL